jgi:hypothetical protein
MRNGLGMQELPEAALSSRAKSRDLHLPRPFNHGTRIWNGDVAEWAGS